MKALLLAASLLLTCSRATAQSTVLTRDVTNFWVAFDSLQAQPAKASVLQRLYLDKASPALAALLRMDSLTATQYVQNIRSKPQRWTSVRQRTVALIQPDPATSLLYKRYRAAYPAFHAPALTFVIGCFGRGGTTTKKSILIGTEVVATDTTKSLVALKRKLTYLIAHELGHVQQDYRNEVENEEEYKHLDLLGWAIMEGSCDFIAEVLLGQLPPIGYLTYGKQHEAQLWQSFRADMYGLSTEKWLYNGGSVKDTPADLGYFIGYAICKRYYQRAANKAQAIRDILELDYKKNAHHAFLQKAGYTP